MHLLPFGWYSEDIFALIDLADVASGIIAGCLHRETGTTLGGHDLVGERALFQVAVLYAEPNQTAIGGEQ